VLTKCVVVTQLLRLDAIQEILCSFNKLIELLIGANVELLEPFKEFGEIGNCRIAKHLSFILGSAQALTQMGH